MNGAGLVSKTFLCQNVPSVNSHRFYLNPCVIVLLFPLFCFAVCDLSASTSLKSCHCGRVQYEFTVKQCLLLLDEGCAPLICMTWHRALLCHVSLDQSWLSRGATHLYKSGLQVICHSQRCDGDENRTRFQTFSHLAFVPYSLACAHRRRSVSTGV